MGSPIVLQFGGEISRIDEVHLGTLPGGLWIAELHRPSIPMEGATIEGLYLTQGFILRLPMILRIPGISSPLAQTSSNPTGLLSRP